MTGYEESLLARAEVLEDTGELVQEITGILAGAQRAGVDPAAVISLTAAACALDPGAVTSYDAGDQQDRRSAGRFDSDTAMLEAVADAEDDTAERLREAGKLQEQAAAAMDAAQAALEAAYAMGVNDPCDGCHGAKEAAIADAERRISLGEATTAVLDPLVLRLQAALVRLRQVPHDLGEVYELVCELPPRPQ